MINVTVNVVNNIREAAEVDSAASPPSGESTGHSGFEFITPSVLSRLNGVFLK